jgi:preprotein translocase subunit YajC
MNFEQFLLIAQDAPAKPPGGMMQMLTPMILIMVIFYFILIRPQRKQAKALENLRSNLNIGDDVITSGGIHGQITGKSDRTVTVRVTDGTKIKFEKSAISQVFPKNKGGKGEDASASADEADEAEEASDDDASGK